MGVLRESAHDSDDQPKDGADVEVGRGRDPVPKRGDERGENGEDTKEGRPPVGKELIHCVPFVGGGMKPERCSKCGLDFSPLMLEGGKCGPCRLEPIRFREPSGPPPPKPLCACGCGLEVHTWKAKYRTTNCRYEALRKRRICACGCGRIIPLRGRKYYCQACENKARRDYSYETLQAKAAASPMELTLRERRALSVMTRQRMKSVPNTLQSE